MEKVKNGNMEGMNTLGFIEGSLEKYVPRRKRKSMTLVIALDISILQIISCKLRG